MLSHDLGNLARALEQVIGDLSVERVYAEKVLSDDASPEILSPEGVSQDRVSQERAAFLTLVCNNLYSLAQQAEMLERVPTIDAVHVTRHVHFLQ